MQRILIVFAREPVAGSVKTRLEPLLGARGCARLYKALLKDTIRIAQAASHDAAFIAYDSVTGKYPYLRRAAKGFRFIRQRGSGLGERLHRTFKTVLLGKGGAAVIIGSDAPDIPPRLIAEAFRLLRTRELVLGPANDGGFYLIGLKRPRRALFRRVPWGGPEALERVAANARAMKVGYALLRTWDDVDDAGSLSALRRRLKRSKDTARAAHTRRFLRCMISKKTIR